MKNYLKIAALFMATLMAVTCFAFGALAEPAEGGNTVSGNVSGDMGSTPDETSPSDPSGNTSTELSSRNITFTVYGKGNVYVKQGDNIIATIAGGGDTPTVKVVPVDYHIKFYTDPKVDYNDYNYVYCDDPYRFADANYFYISQKADSIDRNVTIHLPDEGSVSDPSQDPSVEPVMHMLSVSATAGGDVIIVSGNETRPLSENISVFMNVADGASATFTATAKEGYNFLYFKINGETVTTENGIYTISSITADTDVQAFFRQVAIDPSEDPSGTSSEEPSAEPSVEPSAPSEEPSVEPSEDPSEAPSVDPSEEPSADASADPSADASEDASADISDDASRPSEKDGGGNGVLIVVLVIIFVAVAGAAALFVVKWRQEKF